MKKKGACFWFDCIAASETLQIPIPLLNFAT